MNFSTKKFKPLLLAYTPILLLFTLLSISSLSSAQFWSNDKPALLPEEEAFAVSAMTNDNGLVINWSIANDYYMYREALNIEVLSAGTTIDNITYPQGSIENDPEFGEVEVYFYNLELLADYTRDTTASSQIELKLYGQGCNKPVGVCYPPMQRIVSVTDTNAAQANNSKNLAAQTESSGSTANTSSFNSSLNSDNNTEKSFFAYILAAFGAGILLSFTPCVLPMIPILAGIIAGQGTSSKLRSGMLAVCYVAGTVVTYIIAGALAGATGAQLQAYFQNIWVIGFICTLLLLLAASLFGWFRIELPSSIQTRLQTSSTSEKSASLSSFGLGLVSALVVGACVSPVLILALGAAITKGDPILGASIMGSMAIGMGLLLILFGFGAGWILPKAGAWMNQVQTLFGLMVLGVAIYLLDTLGAFPTLYLWAALLLVAGFFIWHIATEVDSGLLKSSWRALSIGVMAWGLMALTGASLNSTNILNPLETLAARNATPAQTSAVEFTHTTTLDEVTSLLDQAKKSQKPVLIDFYADWCLDCKRMERTTYREQNVISALENWSKIEIDVTDTNDNSEKLKQYFSVFGPPATLFINADGTENQDLRQYGYLSEDDFLALLSRAQY